MTLKRKLDIDRDDLQSLKTKQPKLLPFPNLETDSDVNMFDAEPYYPELHHVRTDSSASTASSASLSPLIETPIYPAFELYPHPFFEGSVSSDSLNDSYYASQKTRIGLLQPSSPFEHHGNSCSQIPKLRIACASGPGGQRAMWSHCEQCGAISMVDSD